MVFFKLVFISIFSFLIVFPITATVPVSKEATIINFVSPAEVYMEAAGIYKSSEKRKRKRRKDVKRNGVQRAIQDAKKSAVYYLIFNGTDPLVSRADEIKRFNKISAEFFTVENIDNMVVYTKPQPKNVSSLDNGEGVKVFIELKANYDYIRKYLEENLVIYSKQELSEELGYPQIMVIPAKSAEQTPLDILKTNKQAQHAAGVIESFLTSKQYEVVVPTQIENINQLAESIQTIKKISNDPVYNLALQVGSDIYLDYSIGQSKSAYDTDQISITIRAYETTTGRLLATETGYSEPRVGEEFVSIEEAIVGAIVNIAQRINKYWEEDLYKGVQYKIITTISAKDISEDKLEEVHDDFFEVLEDVSQYLKENAVTEKTIDVSIWCNNDDIQSSRQLFRELKNEFRDKQNVLRVKVVNRNRKLLILDIK